MQGVGSKIALQKVAANKNKLGALFSVGKNHNQSFKGSQAAPVALFQTGESFSAELVYGWQCDSTVQPRKTQESSEHGTTTSAHLTAPAFKRTYHAAVRLDRERPHMSMEEVKACYPPGECLLDEVMQRFSVNRLWIRRRVILHREVILIIDLEGQIVIDSIPVLNVEACAHCPGLGFRV
jgi:hypothetical protein